MTELFTASPVMEQAEASTSTDSIFNRLLKDRIIWLGSEVKDENANVICAQMLMLAAEDLRRIFGCILIRLEVQLLLVWQFTILCN